MRRLRDRVCGLAGASDRSQTLAVADHGLRQLERRWRASGDPADEAAWVLACLRAGELPAARVEVAALLGHEPAARALAEEDPGAAAPALFDPRSRAAVPDERWLLRELWARSREATVRFAAAVARNRLGARQGAAAERIGAAIAAGEAWALCPCPDHDAAAARLAAEVWGQLAAGVWVAQGPALLGAAFAAALTAEAASAREPRYLFGLLAHEAEGDLSRARAEVVAWALGRDDALAARERER